MYLKSAGSFADAKESERDTLICDENGFAQTKDMPYGTYTVHQVSGWEGRELMDDFDAVSYTHLRYTDAVDDVLIKFTKARKKKMTVQYI